MKNFIASFMIISFAVFSCVVKSSEQNSESPTSKASIEYNQRDDLSFLNGKIGTVLFDRWGEENLTEITNATCNTTIQKFIFSESLTGCLAMIKSGRADFMLTTDVTAIYIAHRNPDLKAIIDPGELEIVMAMRKSDTALRDEFNVAIKKLRDSGKMSELETKWIKELLAGVEPEPVKIKEIANADTIYVGVSGDMPPLDYVDSSGKPAGYNIALLSEISEIIGKNIKIITLDSQARFSALESKRADVFFWMVMSSTPNVQEEMKGNPDEQAFNNKFAFTVPHCVVKTGFLFKK